MSSSLLLAIICIFNFSSIIKAQTPLDDYIKAADPYYNYIDTGVTAKGTNVAGHWTAYLINMTSQMWLNSTYVNKPLWWHWLWIIMPDGVLYDDFATLVITGDHNSQQWPDKGEEYFRASQYVATHTKTIVGVLYDVPNEPLIFYDDPLHKSRSEDAIIAFGWRQYINTYQINPNDPFINNWLVLLPMTKSAVKALDTIANFTASKKFNNKYKVTRFTVAGASKRGWTTWLTAAADDRVQAFVPMVFDMPNMHDELHHMWKAYGGWTFAFEDYYAENLTMYLDTPGFYGIMNATDPIMFFDRYQRKWKMPIDAVNDEFFMPDDEAFWWNKFPEPKYFQINPDAEHSLATAIEELVPTLSTFLTLFLENAGHTMPIIDWEIHNGTGNISITFKGNTSQIVEAMTWHGRSCWNDRRDYRLINLDNPCHCGIYSGGYCINLESIFVAEKLEPVSMTGSQAIYEAGPFKDPSNHWSGFMVSIRVKFFDATHPWLDANGNDDDDNKKKKKECYDKEYQGSDDREFLVEYGEMQFTTQVSIMPQDFPYPDCTGASCYGTLV